MLIAGEWRVASPGASAWAPGPGLGIEFKIVIDPLRVHTDTYTHSVSAPAQNSERPSLSETETRALGVCPSLGLLPI